MKFYIDFDHTLYNTNKLISAMLNSIAEYILINGDFEHLAENFKNKYPNLEPITIEKNVESITQVLKSNFKRPEFTTLKIDYNIFALLNAFGKLFNCNCDEMKKNIDLILDNGRKYLYSDSMTFVRDLKKQGDEVYILSHDRFDLSFQNKKIQGSEIFNSDLIDGIILTKVSKASLDKVTIKNPNVTLIALTDSTKSLPDSIDYKNGIFIDDRPADLEALHDVCYKNQYPPFKTRIYRLRRENGTYANKPGSGDPKYNYGIQSVSSLAKLSEVLSNEQHTSPSGEREMNKKIL